MGNGSVLPPALSGFMLPDWAVLILLLVAGVYALAMLAMPFAVFGVKARLTAMEEQLEDIQEELRVMALRQAGARIGVIDQVYPEPAKGVAPQSTATMTEPPVRRREHTDFFVPIPPAVPATERQPRESFGRARPSVPPAAPAPASTPSRGRRIEPRLD